MKSNYKKVGDFIRLVKEKNRESLYSELLGINIDKFFMPSVANIHGVDLSTYKVVRKGQFACNRMHVGRDYRIPISLSRRDEPFLVSPAYDVFEIKDTSVLLPEYLMMWFSRKEFDRNAWFYTDADVRGGLPWNSFCEIELPIPSIEKQREIVREYNAIVNRITLNEKLNRKLEETAQAIYKQWFVEFEFPSEALAKDGVSQPYKSSGGKMVWCEELEKEIPEGWEVKSLSDLSLLITKGTTPQKFYSTYAPDLISFIKIQSISKTNFVNPLKLEFIDFETHNELKRSQIINDDLLFSITGTLGEFAKATNNVTPSNTNQNIAIIRINQKLIPVNYIFWLLINGWHSNFLVENRQEAVQANLNLAMIGNIRILVPSDDFMNPILKKINVIIDSLFNSHMEIKLFTEMIELILSKMTKVELEKEIIR